MFVRKKILPLLIFLSLLVGAAYGVATSTQRTFNSPVTETDMQQPTAKTDSSVRYPVSNQTVNNYNDLNKEYPMDLKNPDNVKSMVEYDVKTGNYILRTKVGDMDVSTPFTMSSDEYQKYSAQQDMTKYWREKTPAPPKVTKTNFRQPI